MSNGINLLNYKNKEKVKNAATTHKKLRIASIVLLFVVSSFSVMVFILIALSPLPELNKQYNFASFTLSQSTRDIVRLGLVNERSETIKKIIDKRPQYDKIFEYLQNKIPGSITIEAFTIKEKVIALEISSTSLSDIDKFLIEIAREDNLSIKLSKVILSKFSIDSTKNRFVANVDINIL